MWSRFARPSLVSDFLFGPGPVVWFQQLVGPDGAAPFHAISLLGDPWGLLLVLAVSLWLFGRETMYALIPLAIVEASTFLLLNRLIGIPRPDDPAVTTFEELSYSAFPSGHTFLTTTLWMLLFLRGFVPLVVPLVLGSAVGISRLYLGVHHVGDILGGLVLGIALAYGYHRLWPRLVEILKRGSLRAYAISGGIVAAVTVAMLPMMGGNPRWWAVAGIMVASAIALPLNEHLGHTQLSTQDVEGGAAGRRGRRLAILAIGLVGVVAAMAVARVFYDHIPIPSGLAGLGATLWALLITPWLLRRAGSPDEGSSKGEAQAPFHTTG